MSNGAAAAASEPRLGVRANLSQFVLLALVNAFVGAMVGLERTVLPLLAEEEFGVASASVALSFLIAFGVVKALSNLLAGRLADTTGRKRLLVLGWVCGLPVAPMIIWAPSWWYVVAANVLLGVNQGFAWSATLVMKIDLAGPARRGLAAGTNEVAGYTAVGIMAVVTGYLAAAYGPRPAPYLLGVGISVVALAVSATLVKETRHHAAVESATSGHASSLGRSFWFTFKATSFREPSLQAACQAGLATNLNDAMKWGLLPIFLHQQGLDVARIGVVAAVYPLVWGLGQLVTGPWSDRAGRKPLIVAGLWLQAAGIFAFVAFHGYAAWITASVALGVGTALVYPVLIAAVGDVAHPSWRATALGVYRLWRDLGFAVGALLTGVVTDLAGAPAAIVVVGLVTAVSGTVVAARMPETLPVPPQSSASPTPRTLNPPST